MAFKNFGPNCCCNQCYKCQPCTCFTFYDPNTGVDTSDSPFGLNIRYQTYLLFQCPSGGNGTATEGGNYIDLISGYQAGTVVCQPTGFNGGFSFCSPNSFNTAWCTGIPNKGCTEITTGPAKQCYGDASGTNAKMDFLIDVYPDGMDYQTLQNGGAGCAPLLCLCSSDVCATGHNCLPVPYCPTKINLSWDSYYANLFQKNPVINYNTGVCPFSVRDIAPYTSCTITSCLTNFLIGQKSPGECSYWLMPELTWDYQQNKYVLAGGQNATVTAYWGGDYKVYPGPGWNSVLIFEDCKSQELSLCDENNIQVSYTNKGQGGLTQGDWQNCPTDCNCSGTINLPSIYPNSPISFSYNNSVTTYINTGAGFIPVTNTYSATVSVPLDQSTGPPGSLACNTDNVCYQNTCKGISLPIQVGVFGKTHGFPAFYHTLGTVNLQSVSVGLVGYRPNGLCIQSPGTTIPGSPCASARWSVNFNAWACNEILPADGGPGPRTACFDAAGNFLDWADNMGPCCSCACTDPTCTYYYGGASVFNQTGSAYGTIDLCEGIIMLFIYDSQLNIIGTISI